MCAIVCQQELTSASNILSDIKNTITSKSVKIEKQVKRKHWYDRDPAVRLGEESDNEIKRRTNFRSEKELISFVLIVCNGDWDVLTRTASGIMTWYEEWFFYFEFCWGRTLTRWEDAASEKNYGLNIEYLMYVFDEKVNLVLRARSSWSKYATLEEDISLRKEKWNSRYNNQRVVFWDNTNVKMYKPSSASLQESTWSSYYNMNCAKGGVFIQLCGWVGTESLWTGGVGDSQYQSQSSIFREQNEFANLDRKQGEDLIPFINIYDKGYRCTEDAFREGGQITMQPDFAKSDRQFKRKETLSSAAIATDRSGNERGVRLAKECGYIKRGMYARTCPSRMDNVWLAWSFQCNFMNHNIL